MTEPAPEVPEVTAGPVICVLGPITTVVDGEPSAVPTRLARLLTALVLGDGDVVSGDRLVEAVWGPTPPEAASTSLKTYVTRLRQLLGGGAGVSFRHGGYVLELPIGGLDRDRFEGHLDEARFHVRVGDMAAARAEIDAALRLWRGEPFGGVWDEDWARPEAVRLEELHASARALDVEIAIGEVRLDVAIANARRLVEEHPLREQPRRLLMLALYQSGRQADALREYRNYTTIAAEAGLEPSPDLSEFESSLVTGAADRQPEPRVRGFVIGERIGTGAFAVVHRAVQPALDREVAIKIVRAELADRPEFVRRFELEARVVARLEHPHIVPLYDFWREPGAAFLAMRLMRGGSAEAALAARGPLGRDATGRLLGEIGAALATAHRAGVVHRDVRPANLLFDEQGTSYLADFGIATPFVESRSGAGEPNGEGVIIAPAYAAPELLRGDPPGPAADVLSLGVTTFELLSGRLPFADAAGRRDLIRRQLEDPLPPLSSTRRDLPEAVDVVLARATAKAPSDRYPSIEEFVDDMIDALGRDTIGATDRATRVEHPNPYVGLRAFGETDAERFFGRERLVADLVEALERHPMVVVVGPSGSGKSSVVRAGLVPALRRGAIAGSDRWFVTTMVPGTDPLEAFEAAVLRVAVNPPVSLREQLAEDGGLLRAVHRVLPDDDAVLFLVVDQFEELFVQTADDAMAWRFLDELARAVAHPRSPLRLVATLRADYYDAPLRHPGFAELVGAATVPVLPLQPAELERVIVGPAEAGGVRIEPALVAELVAAVADRSASLPLLQFALTELYDRRSGNAITVDTLHGLGGVTGVLAARADRVLDAGTDTDTEAGRNVTTADARRLFGRLVAFDAAGRAARRRAPRSEFADEKSAWLIDAFVKARLLMTDRDETTREPTVEIAHEALLREWPRLRSWLEADRNDLVGLQSVSRAAHEWDRRGREASDLLRGSRLEAAVEILGRHRDRFTPTEVEFVEAGSAARDAQVAAEARQNRRLRRLLMGVATLLVVAVLAAAVALIQRNRAESSRADADVARLVAESAALVDEDRELAILLAQEAYRRRPDAASATAVHRAIGPEPSVLAIRPPALPDVSRVEISADGRTAVAAGPLTDPRIQIVDLGTGDEIGEPVDVGSGVIGLNVSGDGSVVAVINQDLELLVVDHAGTTATVATGVDTGIVAINADGTRLAWLLPLQAKAQVWHGDGGLGEGAVVAEIDLAAEVEGIVAFEDITSSPSGRYLAMSLIAFDEPTETESTSVLVYSTEERTFVSDFEPVEGFGVAVAVTDDRQVATALDDHVLIWDSPTDRAPVRADGHDGIVTSVAFLPSGDLLATGVDGTMRTWSADGRPIGRPIEVNGTVETIAGAADGSVAIGRADGLVTTMALDPLKWLPGRLDVPRFAAVDPALDLVEVAADDRLSFELVDYRNGDPVVGFDVTEVLPGGLDSSVFWSLDGTYGAVWGKATRDAGPLSAIAIVATSGDEPIIVHRTVDLALQLGVGEDAPGGRVAVRVSNDGRRLFLIIPTVPGFVAGWFDAAAGTLLAGPRPVDSAGEPFLLDDGRVLIGAAESTLAVFDADLQEETAIEGGAGFKPLGLGPDGDWALVGAGDGSVAVLDLDTLVLSPVATVGDHAFKGAVSPDGRYAAVALLNTGVQLVDIENGALVGAPLLEGVRGAGFPKVRWADDGETVWFAGVGAVLQVDASPEAWFERACTIVGRTMEVEDWQRYVDADTEPVDPCPGA